MGLTRAARRDWYLRGVGDWRARTERRAPEVAGLHLHGDDWLEAQEEYNSGCRSAALDEHMARKRADALST